MPKVFTKESKNLYKLWSLSLQNLRDRLKSFNSLDEKIKHLRSLKEVKQALSSEECQFLEELSPDDLYLVLVVAAIDQTHILSLCQSLEARDKLLLCLRNLEAFFQEEGGVIGYQIMALNLLEDYALESDHQVEETFYPPHGLDVTKSSKDLDEIILLGIQSQENMAEIYPVGGAADRLNLHDETTHLDLPAARLEFLGKTLLEGMIRDLQAREYLYFKISKKQVTTPVALMTSEEKNNDAHIRQIFVENKYFGRNKNSFKFFVQHLVPTFTQSGKWCLKDEKTLLCKPGGHGVIWKLAKEQGVLTWLKKQKRQKALIRQINNPIAGVDLGLLALVGLGFKSKRCFGFASCLRRLQTSEGINILKEKKSQDGFNVVLSNIEYCDFKKFNIEDVPREKGSKYSVFPSNTNILFADITSTEKAIETCPFPGSLVNFKEMSYFQDNIIKKGEVARVELLMQNIADGFVKSFEVSAKDNPQIDVRAFMTFNKRHKTISPTKKQFVPGSGLVETAMGCFFDYLFNIYDLFTNYCNITMPKLSKEDEFLQSSLDFCVFYHPALGPLYSIIAQKIQGGSFSKGSELQLEISELEIKNLNLEGSLHITADQILGHIDNQTLIYSEKVGSCILKNVSVKNLGIDHAQDNIYWKNKIQRKELMRIHLEGQSLFIAEDVTFSGSFDIHVKDRMCLKAEMDGDQVIFKEMPLDNLSLWRYKISNDNQIELEK